MHPKSIAREMLEDYEGFDDVVRRYGLQRSEGLLLRYLSQVHATLEQSVPDAQKTDARRRRDRLPARARRAAPTRACSRSGKPARGDPAAASRRPRGAQRAPARLRLAGGERSSKLAPKAFQARVRTELQRLVRALAHGDYEEAARWVRQGEDEPWDAARFAAELAPFLAVHERVAFDPAARRADQTVLKSVAPLVFRVQHVLPDPAGEGTGYLEGEIDLRGGAAESESALVRLLAIHP